MGRERDEEKWNESFPNAEAGLTHAATGGQSNVHWAAVMK